MTNVKTKGGEKMKVVVKLYKFSNAYYVESADGYTSIEVIKYATAKDRKLYPEYAPRLNKDEARIYAKQRADFYNSRITK
jgi:hypothetical protein